MKKQLFSFLLLLALIISVSAQKAQTPKADSVEQNLRKHVSYLASEKLEGRRTGEKGAVSAAGYVTNRFAEAKLKGGVVKNGKRLFLQSFPYKKRNEKGEIASDAKEVEAYNVIGILEGTDPALKDEAIVIGAHYDHLGKGGMGSLAANSTEVHHGADDNASGTSALIELAAQFAKANYNHRTLIFIAFGGEEEGLLGSRHYVNNPVFPLDKTIAMINLDMVGRLQDNKLTVGGIGTANELKAIVQGTNRVMLTQEQIRSAAQIARNQDGGPNKTSIILTPPLFTLQLNEDGFGPSDHSSFYAKQIPVLFLFTGTHLDYHKPTDTAEKINYEGLSLIVGYVSEIVKRMDLNPIRPTYAVAKSSGTSDTARVSSGVTLGTIPGYADSTDGMVIDGVRDGLPAAKAGLKAGDKIIKLAGKDIRNVQDYTKVLSELKADTEYEIIFMRGGERIVARIIPAARK